MCARAQYRVFFYQNTLESWGQYIVKYMASYKAIESLRLIWGKPLTATKLGGFFTHKKTTGMLAVVNES